MIKFSIIIPVRKINDYLKESIPYLKNLDYKNFEVLIVVDFTSDYEINDKRFKTILAPKHRQSPGEKRNIGADHATGDILVFLDDDAFPKENWLREAGAVFKEDETIYALGAPAMTPKNAGIAERASGRILESYLTSGFTIYRHIPQKRRLVDDYPSVNLFVKKNAFDKVRGFDKEFWPGEDTKLCLDLVMVYKRKFLYDPRPQVYHHRRDVFISHLKQISRYGRHRGQFARIFPETSLIPSYFVPSLFILGLFSGPIVCLMFPVLWDIYFGIIAFYLALLFIEGIRTTIRDKHPIMFILFVVGVLLTHVTYGVSILIGLIKRPKLKLRRVEEKTGNYLGG